MKYDIFISYRREGGAEMAQLLHSRLALRGWRVFLDVEALRSGKFNEQLYSRIDECSDVLVLMSKNSLVLRPRREDDWFRLEIAYALKSGKNIIPILLRDFVWPDEESLPEDVRDLSKWQGTGASHEHFESTLSRIEGLLKTRKKRRKLRTKILVGLGFLFSFLILSSIWVFRYEIFGWPISYSEKQTYESIITNLAIQVSYTNEVFTWRKRLLFAATNAYHSKKESLFQEEYNMFSYSMKEVKVERFSMPLQLLEDLKKTPISSADFNLFSQSLEANYKSALKEAEMFKTLLPEWIQRNEVDALKVFNIYGELYKLETEYCSFSIMYVLRNLRFSKLAKLKKELFSHCVELPLLSGVWIRNSLDLKSQIEGCLNQIERQATDLATILGEMNLRVNALRQKKLCQLTDAGLEKEEAIKAIENVELVSAKGWQLYELKKKVREKNVALEEARKRLQEKIAPSKEDDVDLLYGKMLKFLSLKGKEANALECLKFIRDKNEPMYSKRICDVLEAIIKKENERPTGLLVCMIEPPAITHAIYRVGDIIMEENGVSCEKHEDYRGKAGGRYRILRLCDTGVFEEVFAIMPEEQPRVALIHTKEKEP